MSFQPVVPLSGFAGWAFLKRTRDAQQAAFDKSAQVVSDTKYFKDNIAKADTPEALVKDYRLLKVALGAYGLDDDINSKYFVRRVLEDGSLATSALANKLSDKRYLAMATAFGYDLGTPSTAISTFADKVTAAYKSRQFEIAVGEQNSDLRLAMGLGRELSTAVKQQTTNDGRWFAVMGNPAVRTVFEKALGLPTSFGRLDVDLQLKGFKEAAERNFGTSDVSTFTDPDKQEQLIRRFLVRSEATAAAQTSSGQIALMLLGGG